MNPEYERLRALGYKTFKELDEAMAAGRIKSYGMEEVNQARVLEKALFPADIKYPKEGDIYVAREDTEINYSTSWETPYTGGGKAILPKNEPIKVLEMSDEQPIMVSFAALNYKRLEKIIVPKEDRNAGKYSGYYIHVRTLLLHQAFDLIEENSHKKRIPIWDKWRRLIAGK